MTLSVLMFSWEFPPFKVGGLAAHVFDLSKMLVKKGLEVHVVTCSFPGTKDYELINGVHVHRFDAYAIPAPEFLQWDLNMNLLMERKAVEIIQKYNIDILHAHDWLVASAAIGMKHLYRKPLIATIHSLERGRRNGLHNDGQRMLDQIENLLIQEAWHNIVCSQYMQSLCHFSFNFPKDKMTIIPNGVRYNDFSIELSKEEKIKHRLKYASEKDHIIGFIGRLVPEKGVNILLGSVKLVLKSVPKTKFVIAGEGWHRSELERIAKELGINEKVLFTGYLPEDDFLPYLNVTDILVVPSTYEPFGIVALEGMATKTPIIVSDVGGLSEIIDHKWTGMKVPADNSQFLAESIIELLQNEKLRKLIVKNAIGKLMHVYDWSIIADHTIKIYERIFEEWKSYKWKTKEDAKRYPTKKKK
ncbi:MAG TPA: glycosyltransferase family 4 protein [candidate division Zixibacteria bacterium]|nr:glycosyltransferase family 4 protein [candidate division Zixibacteria bacterium]